MGMLVATSLAALGILIAADRAAADLWIEMTGCDQELVDGVSRPHVRFAVYNAGGSAITSVLMFPPAPPALQDTCHVFTIDQVPGWSGAHRPDGGAAWSTPAGSSAQIGVRQTLGGFGVTLSGTDCCFRITLNNEFRSPAGSTIYCFQCDLPSATAQRTWGALKAIYR
jgi:hypothetical protein